MRNIKRRENLITCGLMTKIACALLTVYSLGSESFMADKMGLYGTTLHYLAVWQAMAGVHWPVHSKITLNLLAYLANWPLYTLKNGFQAGLPRGFGGPRASTKSGAPQKKLCEGGLGARPQEILRFNMLWSVFWGLLRLFFVHAHSKYIHASWRLRLAVSDRKVRRTGP